MKIEVRNLGVITEAQIDLKPLTIFVGPNNAGKTWLAYAIAGSLGPYGWSQYTNAYVADEVYDTYPVIDQAIQQVLDEGNTKIDLVQFAEEYGEEYFNNVVRYAKQWMRQFMNTGRIAFDDLDMKVILADTKSKLTEQVLNFSLNSQVSVSRQTQQSLLTMFKEAGKRDLFVYTSTESDISEKLPGNAIRRAVFRNIFRIFHISLYPDTFTFPTERSVYITPPFSYSQEISTEATTAISGIGSDQVQQLVSWPIARFLSMVLLIKLAKKIEREEEGRKNSKIETYLQLGKVLENQILGGDVDFSTPDTTELRRELLFSPNNGMAMKISVASSMVKELSSLVLYLRYTAKPNDWLIIDEPEMNLHPEAQARFTEFLAMLVHAGLQILLTTHSPYVVDHLANLMKAAESTEPDAITEKFYLQRKEAFIPKDKVSVYMVDNGKTENILDENGVIHWDTFSKVSDRVMQIYFEL